MPTVEQYLAMTDEKLALEAAEVLTPGPWKHKWAAGGCFTFCKKCQCNMIDKPRESPCTVPDRIKLDWNTAMEWRDKVNPIRWFKALVEIWLEETKEEVFCERDVLFDAQPRHYLIAAAMAEGNKA